MKKILPWLALLLPLVVFSATQQYRVTWNPLPADQTVTVERSINGGPYQSVGQAPGSGSVQFSADVNPGDTINVRAWASKPAFPDSPRSEVAVLAVPLEAPKGVTIQAAP